ncbi:MAG TPA: CoA pyrophosphatase [Acidimicrobiia bacterium]|nr:CoA pyrophosphatase [Acidimicrobiia bacterium]
MASRRGGQQRIPRPPSYRPGSPAPWSELPPERRKITLDEVRTRLAALPPAADAPSYVTDARAAAVLVPMFEADEEAHVVLIKRPEWMPSHKGEIAFPGGKFEPGVDTDLRAAALREAHEEVGLAPGDVEVVAQLDGIGTVASRFTITPFVGFLRGRPALEPNPFEVERVLMVPLSELLDADVYREERWDTWIDDLNVHFYELDDETVWGATARILTSFLAHLVAGS